MDEMKSKCSAMLMYETHVLDTMDVGTFKTLSYIHSCLFNGIYECAGQLRTINISKEDFRFASTQYLGDTVHKISKMPDNTLEEIIEKYIEMNIAHPFIDGNGRSMRIWLDHMLKHRLNKVVNWESIEKEIYFDAMKKSVLHSNYLVDIVTEALSNQINDKAMFMRSLDTSYQYEGLDTCVTEELICKL